MVLAVVWAVALQGAGIALASSADEIPIDVNHFPDGVFLEYVKTLDIDGNGSLSPQERDAVTVMEFISGYQEQPIKDLTGISYFANLTELNCYDNQLTALDLRQNTALTSLNCGSNQLESLDVTQNTRLVTLECFDNRLTALDLRQNTALEEVECSDNPLKTLNVSANANLKVLFCSSAELTALDVTQNAMLQELNCSGNQLTALDVTHNPELMLLSCSSNQLGALDVSKNAKLDNLVCSENALKELDVSGNLALTNLDCANNLLARLDVSANTKLEEMDCSANRLMALNASGNQQLRFFKCDGQKPELEVSQASNGLWTIDIALLPDVDVGKLKQISVQDAGLLNNETVIWNSKDIRPVLSYRYDTGKGDMRVELTLIPIEGNVGSLAPVLPQTGDGGQPVLWAALLALSILGLTLLMLRARQTH